MFWKMWKNIYFEIILTIIKSIFRNWKLSCQEEAIRFGRVQFDQFHEFCNARVILLVDVITE